MNNETSNSFSRYSIETGNNDIAAVLNILYERKYIILLFFLLGFFLSYLYVFQAKEQYSASAKIMLSQTNTASRTGSALQTLLSTGKLDIADLLSQIEVIKSPEILAELIKDQKLFLDPNFAGSSVFNNYDEITTGRQRAIINSVKNNLSITPVLGTSIIEISMKSGSLKKAADIINALIKVYGQKEIERNQKKAEFASDWLAERLEILEEEVRDAEIALENAKEENNLNLASSDDSRLIRIELLTKELSIAQGEKAETEATLGAIKKARSNNLRMDAIPDIVSNKVIENFKFEEARLLKRKAMLEERYGPKHPEMIAFSAEFKGFRERLKSEIETIYLMLGNQVKIDDRRIEGLNNAIAKYRDSYKGDAEQRLKIRNLRTSADTSRALLSNFTKSYLESLQNVKMDRNPIRIIAEAVPSPSPIYPKKSLIVVLSSITGLFLGIFIALVMERIQNTIQTPQQIEKLTSLPVFGLIPKTRFSKHNEASQYITENPASLLSELVRTLFTTIQLRKPHHKNGGRVITLTSTLSGEGKTTTSIWLATIAAQNGKKVLILDADMRRPSLHKAYGIGNSKGLVDYLSDRLPLDETIYKKHPSGVHVMTGKAIPTHALTLLNSERMDTLLRRLKDDYDLIIIDVPTALIFSDALVMAKQSDHTLYVVEANSTKIPDFIDSVKKFTEMGYKDLSFVLNKVEDKKLNRYMKKIIHYNSRNT
jgi:succinoglycan biosynthesis transport protein ExoP